MTAVTDILPTAARPLPAGPESWFPGELVWSLRSDVLGYLTRLARTWGDFVPFRAGGWQYVFLNDPDAIREVLVTKADPFVKGPALRRAKDTLGEGLLTSEGDFHRRQRRLSQPAFQPQRVAGYADVFARTAGQAAESWQDGQVVDAHEQMMRVTLRIVAETLFGADVGGDVDAIGHAMDVSVRMFTRAMSPWGPVLNRLPLPSNFRFKKARRLLFDTIDRFVARRRADFAAGRTGRTDLLSTLLRATDDVGATPASPVPAGRAGVGGNGRGDAQLRDEALTVFTAGHETTANALTFAWYLLARHPEAEARLHAEVDAVLGGRPPGAADLDRLPYTRAVVAEAMRLYPPALGVGRESTEAVEVGGYVLPPRTVVLMSQWVTHRDGRWWSGPARFDPGRWLTAGGDFGIAAPGHPRYAYYPFGGGPRSCIGEAFAWAEAVLVLATVARRWAMRLARPAGPLELIPTITLRPRYGVPVVLRRRG